MIWLWTIAASVSFSESKKMEILKLMQETDVTVQMKIFLKLKLRQTLKENEGLKKYLVIVMSRYKV